MDLGRRVRHLTENILHEEGVTGMVFGLFGRFWLLRDAFDDEPSLLAELSGDGVLAGLRVGQGSSDELLLLADGGSSDELLLLADGDCSEVIELTTSGLTS